MISLDSVQIIKEKEKPKFAVIDYKLFLELKEIIEDFLDHLHAEAVLENTDKDDWIDIHTVKKELGIH